jgi:hypothetical protein
MKVRLVAALAAMGLAMSVNLFAFADQGQEQQIRQQVNQNTAGDDSANRYYNSQLDKIQNDKSINDSERTSQERKVEGETNQNAEMHQQALNELEYERQQDKANGIDDSYSPSPADTFTLNSTLRPSDKVVITFTWKSGATSVNYTLTATDTPASAASALAKEINDQISFAPIMSLPVNSIRATAYGAQINVYLPDYPVVDVEAQTYRSLKDGESMNADGSWKPAP